MAVFMKNIILIINSTIESHFNPSDLTGEFFDGMTQNQPKSICDKVCGIRMSNTDSILLENDYKALLIEFSPYE
ncbi:hypothetical protein AT251_16560 [Enterovibrio nigricans]|nr:hypothetical protein AT251_16560 [Enterovibrio nigricans]